MNILENKKYSMERALYSLKNTNVKNCKFYGKEDGESSLKECKNIIIDAEFDGEISGSVVFITYDTDENNCVVHGEQTSPFSIMGKGERQSYAIDISSAPDCFLGFSLRFANEGHIKVYSVEIK